MNNQLLAVLLIGGIVLLGLLLVFPERGVQEARITLSEWSLQPATLNLPPGPIKFVVTNSGTMEHAFKIESQALHKELGGIEHIASGQTKAVTVNLKAGEYELYCPIPGQKEKGLVGKLVITAEAAQTSKPITPAATQSPSPKPTTPRAVQTQSNKP